MSKLVSRRTLLGASVAAAAVAGCTPIEAPPPPGGSASKARVPTYQAFAGVTADRTGSGDGIVQDVFTNYPKEPAKVFSAPPVSSGRPVSVMVPLDSAITPPPMGQNPFFAELQQRLGTKVELQLPPAAQYQEKVAVVLAGNELPDVMHIRLSIAPPRLPQLLEAKFADLTPHLSGDAIKEYPSLAALPTTSWQGAMFSGKLHGVARTVPLARWFLYQRSDLTKPVLGETMITSGEHLLEAFAAVTNPRRKVYASTGPSELVAMIHQMKGGSNVWSDNGGRFISMFEEPQYREALELVRRMWSDGMLHPKSFDTPQASTWFETGEICFWYSASDPVLLKRRAIAGAPAFENTRQLPPGWTEGTKATFPLENPTNGLTVIRKGLSDDRVVEVLKMINYLTVPFGTEEYRFVTYGIAGEDFTLTGSNPVLTKQGENEVNPIQLGNVTRPTPVLYAPDYPEIVAATQTMQLEAKPNAAFPANVGLYSETALNKGATINRALADVRSDIIQGRRQISAWDEALANWRLGGGDQIRNEYEEAVAQR